MGVCGKLSSDGMWETWILLALGIGQMVYRSALIFFINRKLYHRCIATYFVRSFAVEIDTLFCCICSCMFGRSHGPGGLRGF
jgi:hypothetical protein